ncbi:MAG: class I SAM-dependent methyltransferase [Acidimicrobiia bacterium]
MQGYGPATYGDRFADVYDAWYSTVTDLDGCVARVAAVAAEVGGGPVLELGVGTGRLALPLAERGLEVHGVDASAAMLDRCRAKPGADRLHLSLGDMAELALVDPPAFAVVLVAFNTLFNLPAEADQRRCLARCAALLAPGGALLVEAFVPDEDPEAATRAAVEPHHIGVDDVVLTVSRSDFATQTVQGQHVHLREDGIRLRPWSLRWATPTQLDDMAAAAGLEPWWRRGGWRDEPFDGDSALHVSAWRRR